MISGNVAVNEAVLKVLQGVEFFILAGLNLVEFGKPCLCKVGSIVMVKMVFGFFFLFVSLTTFASNVSSNLTMKTWVNGVEGSDIKANAPAVLELQFYERVPKPDSENDSEGGIEEKLEEKPEGVSDRENENFVSESSALTGHDASDSSETEFVDVPLADFKNVAMKSMHLVMIKEDLSSFSHFHPVFDVNNQQFIIPLHLPMQLPDNADAVRAVSTPGNYLMYAEVESKKYGLITKGVSVRSEGEYTRRSLVADTLNSDGIYEVYLEGSDKVSTRGAGSKFEISTEKVSGEGGDLWRFLVTMKRFGDEGYAEVEALSPWLGMGGHAILISEKGTTPAEKVFEHFHSPLPKTGGKLSFNHFARGGLDVGLYKIWFQLRHEDIIYKVPLVMEI